MSRAKWGGRIPHVEEQHDGSECWIVDGRRISLPGDYQSDADGLPSEGYPLKPSELFQRQCYFTCWYDRMSLRVRGYLGTANVLWSSHFPLATSTWPNTRRRADLAFAELPETEKTTATMAERSETLLARI